MKKLWKWFCYSFLILILFIDTSIVSADVNDALLSPKENELYEKLSSTFVPTALMPFHITNQKCVEDSRYYVKALLNQSEWALSMFQASGRLPFDGSTNFMIPSFSINVQHDPGLFDQCISTSSPSGRIRGQYCSVFLSSKPHNDSSLNEPKVKLAERQIHPLVPVNVADLIIGFCVPSSCSAKDLQTAIAHRIGRTTFQKKNLLHSIVTSNHDRLCHTEIKIQNQSAIDSTCIAFIVVIGFIVFLILISTLYEFRMRAVLAPHRNIEKVLDDRNIFHCFSAMRNVEDLLSIDSSDDISCLHGIRVMSFFLIILVHTGEQLFRRSLYNRGAMVQAISTWVWQPVANATVLVDTFFLMGGLLVCNSLLKDLDRSRFNLNRFYFHRYLRLTPLYAAIIFFLAAFAGRLGSGPDWNPAQYRSEDCRSYWWSHLLYINNRIPSSNTFCMPETWYLAAEMQMFIFSPIIIYPLWRWPRRAGPLLIALLLVASLGYSTAIYLAFDLPPTMMGTRPSMMRMVSEYLQYYYVHPFARCPPYLIGILLGWILHHKNKITLSKLTVMVGWILSFIIQMVILYGLSPYLDDETVPVINPFFRVIYGVFHRTLWSVVISWIIFVCVKGYGGSVNDLLSNKIFVLLAKLCFAGYLVHYSLIEHYISQFRTPFYFTSMQLIVTSLGILVLTFVLSAFLTIAIEIPFRNLEKIILPNARKNGTVKSSSTTSGNYSKEQ